MSNKALRMFYAIVVTLSVLVGVIASNQQSASACGAGSCGGSTGIFSVVTLK